MRHAGYVRNFEWLLRELVDRGHTVHLGFERTRDQFPVPETIVADANGAITSGTLPRGKGRRAGYAAKLRQSVSYLRYLSPTYRDAHKLRRRWERGTPRSLVLLTRVPGMRSRPVLAALERTLRSLEARTTRTEAHDRVLREGAYDGVLVTPLVDGPWQHEWVHASHHVGVPIALLVASWDNLTNKGVLFDKPDRTYVWNETQRREAVEMHGLDASAVVAVGAHTFDHWFEWRVSRDRETFCAAAGLDASKPFVLYVCSSGFIVDDDERPLVRRWIETIRREPGLEDVGVLVRPHPTNGNVWREHSLCDFENVTVWPQLGANPTDVEARSDFYDSMFHCAAVVGANTTAMIDAAIVGRRTFSFLLPELRGAQEGTLHFHYLLPENGGALVVGRSLEEHAQQLAAYLRDPDVDSGWRERFLVGFVRPHGLDVAGTPRLADELEAFVTRPRHAGAERPATARTA
jgi:hypothetical protein